MQVVVGVLAAAWISMRGWLKFSLFDKKGGKERSAAAESLPKAECGESAHEEK